MIDTDERALAVLDGVRKELLRHGYHDASEAIAYLRRRLAQPDQSEPVAWRVVTDLNGVPGAVHFLDHPPSPDYAHFPNKTFTPLYTHPDRTQAPGESGEWRSAMLGIATRLRSDAAATKYADARHAWMKAASWIEEAVAAIAPTPPSVPGKGCAE